MEAIAAPGAGDTLAGPAEDTVWHLDGPDSGRVRGIAFTGMENLTGADDNADQFYLGEDASLTGAIAGGENGFDTLFFDKNLFESSSVDRDPDEAGTGNVELDGTVIRYTGMETPRIVAQGDDADRTLVLSGASDVVVLRRSEGGAMLLLESKNGFAIGAEFVHPTRSLTIKLGGGDDRITIEGFGIGTGTSLTVEGQGEGLSSGSLDIIEVAEDALITTRMLGDPNGDPMTAYSIGDSGDVILDAEKVHVLQGARILTHVVPGSRARDGVAVPEAGDVTLGDGTGGEAALIRTRMRKVTIESRAVAEAFDPASAVDAAADTIGFGGDHDLQTGDAVRYFTGGGGPIGGLEDGTTYFAIVDTDRKIKLAQSYAKAKAGNAIDISAVGTTGTEHRITEGVLIDASGDPGGTAGKVTVRATNRPLSMVSPIIDFYVLESRIEIASATIWAGDVSVESEANARIPTVDGWASGLLFNLTTFGVSLPGMVLSMLTGLNMMVSVRHATSFVELRDTEVVSSGTVTIDSQAHA